MQAYCVTCRKKVDIVEPETVSTKNKHTRVKGKCSLCQKGVSTFAKSQPKEEVVEKAPAETEPVDSTSPKD